MAGRSLARILPLLFFTLGMFAFVPSVSCAAGSLTISKVVADVPGSNAGHQYIEVTNTGSDTIDLGAKTIRLVDHAGKHLIKSYDDASTELAPGETVAIAQNPATFLADNSGYTGVVLKSSFSLTETGIVQIVETAGADATVLAVKSYASVPVAKKPSAAKKSSTKQQKVTHKTHDKGITAPSVAAEAGAGGAVSGSYGLPLSAGTLATLHALTRNGWFALFLCLLAFSTFSVIVIESQQPHS